VATAVVQPREHAVANAGDVLQLQVVQAMGQIFGLQYHQAIGLLQVRCQRAQERVGRFANAGVELVAHGAQ
jgi:hypothetical protein